MRDVVVHQDLGEDLSAEWGEEESLQAFREGGECLVVWRKAGSEGGSIKDGVTRLGFLPVVAEFVELASVQSLDGRSEGGKLLGEEEVFVKQRGGGKERVLQGVEDTVLGLDVGNEDSGVEVEVDGWDGQL